MRPEARQALAELVREYGKAIVRMPSSCQMYMAVKLADFPDEKDQFAAALRNGVPEQILANAGTDGYPTKLIELSRSLAKTTGLEPAAANEVVTAWAEALNRPADYRPAAVPQNLYPDEAKPDPHADNTVRWAMAAIAAVGGCLGTGLGSGAALAVMAITDAALSDAGDDYQAVEPGLMWLVIAVKMLLGGAAGGFAGGAGWLMGRGDQKPWAGFAAAFGSGLTMGLILLSFSSSIFRLVAVAVAVFGATYTTAARGGYKS